MTTDAWFEDDRQEPLVRGSRVAAIGFVAFLVCYFIESLV